MTRDSFWFLLVGAVALLMAIVALCSFPVALACGIRSDLADLLRGRR